MNAAEDRLSELMDAATRALAPPIDAILAQGERLGRRRRRRRRAAVATGTAAVVLLAGAGAAVGLRLTREMHDVDAAAPVVQHVHPPAPHTATAPATSPLGGAGTPVASPTASATLNATLVPITASAAVAILKMRLGATFWYGSYQPSNSGNSLLDFDINDGKGLSRVFVAVGSTKQSGMDPLDCALEAALVQGGGQRPPGAPPAGCNVTKYANGDLVMQAVLKADAYGEYQYRIIANRSDGIAVEITVSNGDWNSAATEVTRNVPPLTVAQWTAVALDPLWQLEVPAKLAK